MKIGKIKTMVCALTVAAALIIIPTFSSYASYVTYSSQNSTSSPETVYIVAFPQETAKLIGEWELESDQTSWRFRYYSGGYAANSWVEDSSQEGLWYFLDSDGVMLRSAVTPDGYTVDSEGRWFAGGSGTSTESGSAVATETGSFEPVPISQLANLTSLRKKCTDAELQEAK